MANRNFDAISTPSDKLRNTISLICSISACLVFIVFVMIFMLVDISRVSRILDSFTIIFFIELAIIVVALFFALTEIIRNPFPSSIISIVLSVVATVCIIIFLIAAKNNYSFTLF